AAARNPHLGAEKLKNPFFARGLPRPSHASFVSRMLSGLLLSIAITPLDPAAGVSGLSILLSGIVLSSARLRIEIVSNTATIIPAIAYFTDLTPRRHNNAGQCNW